MWSIVFLLGGIALFLFRLLITDPQQKKLRKFVLLAAIGMWGLAAFPIAHLLYSYRR